MNWYLLSIILTLFQTEMDYLQKRNSLVEHDERGSLRYYFTHFWIWETNLWKITFGVLQEVHLETSDSNTMRLVTTSTRFSLPDLWLKDFVWRSTSNHLFTPYEMYSSTLRAIDINGGSLVFVNSSHHWLVIKWCLSIFDDKSYIRMARLVPEWSSEWDKETPDLVSAIQATILGFLYTSSIWWPYIYIFIQTWAYICRHVCIGKHFSFEEFLNYVHVIRFFMCWTWECLPSTIMIKEDPITV